MGKRTHSPQNSQKRQCLEARDLSTALSGTELGQDALLVRGKFPEIVTQTNKYEEDWCCDICMSRVDEEDDHMVQCELCLVVVHQNCYRRDLYKEVDDDDQPWNCARCAFLMETPSANAPPHCSFCPDERGALVRLKSKEWVHIVCVNWINEIWFETEDIWFEKYGGELDLQKFGLQCYLCKSS